MASLTADRETLAYTLTGVGSVRTAEANPNGAAFTVSVERLPDEEPPTARPVATMIPFVGRHHHSAAAPMAAMAMTPPSAPAAPPTPKTHGGLFALDRELVNAAQSDPRPVEVAIVVTGAWLDGRDGPAPTVSSVALDLTLTRYAWS